MLAVGPDEQPGSMNVLWIYAHPEPRSLTGALRDTGLKTLANEGHTYRETDLYALGWRSTVDRDDFPEHPPEQRLFVANASKRAHHDRTLATEIQREQEKLIWADTVVLQFPLWWYSTPAILKGWIDRVFVKGFAYGVNRPDEPGLTARYGEGLLSGKRAQVVVTIGGPEASYGPRGVNGDLELVLFPLLHGTLFYTGMTVLPPLAFHRSDRVSDEEFAEAERRLTERIRTLETTPPLPYRHQNGGDYDENLVLHPDRSPGVSGLSAHYATEVEEGVRR